MHKFQRQALYEEVWQQPLSTLGPKYDLSDNGLRKICKRLEIPLPPRGYWARKAAGQLVQQVPLHTAREAPASVMSNPTPRSVPDDDLTRDQAWLATRLTWEKTPAAAIPYDPAPQRWHPLVEPVAAYLLQRAHELTADKKRRIEDARARVAAHPRVIPQRSPDANLLIQLWSERQGDQLVTTHRAAALRVSPVTVSRSLAVLNAICLAAEARGCQITDNDAAGRYELVLEGSIMSFAIRERPDYKDQPRPFLGGTMRVAVPRDCLAVVIDRPTKGGGGELLDRPGARIETRLHELFSRLYRFVVQDRHAQRDETAKQARLAIIRADNARADAQRLQVRAADEAEEARRADLAVEAHRWAEAEEIRRYLDVIERAPGHTGAAAGRAEWLAWARRVAHDLDPLPLRMARFKPGD